MGVLAAAADVFLGSTCAACRQPGWAGCLTCLAVLDRLPPPRLLNVGGLRVATASSYDGVARDFVVGHKERRRYALTGPLGHLLARAIRLAAVTATTGNSTQEHPLEQPLLSARAQRPGRQSRPTIVVVPIPSAPRRTRSRGHDPLGRLVRVAQSELLPELPVHVAPLLAHRRRVADQSDLDRVARQHNLIGAFGVRARRLDHLMTTVLCHRELTLFIIVDDILTSGSTLGEAARALSSVGLTPGAGAVICAVNRRR